MGEAMPNWDYVVRRRTRAPTFNPKIAEICYLRELELGCDENHRATGLRLFVSLVQAGRFTARRRGVGDLRHHPPRVALVSRPEDALRTPRNLAVDPHGGGG